MKQFIPVALMLIPDLDVSVERSAYYNACCKKIRDEEYVLINPLSYYDYIKVVDFNYFMSVKECLNAVFVFTDFPPNRLIEKIYTKYPDLVRLRENEAMVFKNNADAILDDALARAKYFYNMTIDYDTIVRKTRKQEIVLVRQFIMKKVKESTLLSLASVGSIFGKDHATVLHAIRRINTEAGLIEKYNEFWGEMRPKLNDPAKESIIAELEMRKQPVFENPFASIPAHETTYSGFREHSL